MNFATTLSLLPSLQASLLEPLIQADAAAQLSQDPKPSTRTTQSSLWHAAKRTAALSPLFVPLAHAQDTGVAVGSSPDTIPVPPDAGTTLVIHLPPIDWASYVDLAQVAQVTHFLEGAGVGLLITGALWKSSSWLQTLYEKVIVNRFKNESTREFLRMWGARGRYTLASLGAVSGFAAAGGDFSSLVGGGTIFIGAAALAGKDLAVHYLSGGTLNVEGNFETGDYVEGDGFKGYIIARTYRITTFVEFIDKNDPAPTRTPTETTQPAFKEPPRLDDVLADPTRYVAILHRIPNTKLTDRTGEWISHRADPEKLHQYFALHNDKPGQKKIPLDEKNE